MVGYRDPNFYRALTARTNVVLAPTQMPQGRMIEIADAVVTMNGSAGIESFMRGKPVFVTGDPYYATGRLYHHVQSLDELRVAAGMLIEDMVGQQAPSGDEVRNFVRRMLETCLPCDANEVRFDAADELRRRKVDHAVEVLRSHLPNWLNLARAELAAA